MRNLQLAIIAFAAMIAVAAGNKTALEPLPHIVVTQCPPSHDVHDIIYMEHSDCSMYYVCRFGKAYEMYCPVMDELTGERLHFNPLKEECDWPGNVACNGHPNPPVGKECIGNYKTSHESNCGYYYECVNGKKVLRSCGGGLHFNPFAQECQIPSEAGCDGTVQPPKPTPGPKECEGDYKLAHENNCGYYYECINGKKSLRSCGGGLHFNPFAQECQIPSEAGCDGSAPKPTLPPLNNECEGNFKSKHESNCGYYYECVNGKKTLRSCGGGLHFNPFAQECQIPSQAGCDGATPTPKPTLPPVGHECVGNYKSKHESNCGYYYECVNGKKQLKACPTGLHFNPFSQVCQNPTEAGCETTRPTPKPTLPPVNKECEGTHKLQHESNCGYYYECVNGKKTLRSCGSGLHFNPFAQVCQIPSEAGCERPAPTPKPTLPPLGGNECVGNYKSKHESNCGYYYECVNGKKTLKACGGGLHFNPFAQTCQIPSEAGCEITVPTPKPTLPPLGNECVGNYKSKHESNCGYYYQCVNGKKTLKACGSGLHFNPFAQTCQIPSEAGCETTAPTPKPTLPPLGNECVGNYKSKHESNCGYYYQCVNGKKTLKACGGGLHFNPFAQTCQIPSEAGCQTTIPTPKPTLPPTNNECVGNYKSPHPTNCGYYYDCVSGKKQLRACQSGLHFNPFAQTCQDPSIAGCNKFFDMLMNAFKSAHTSGNKVSETSFAVVAKTS